MTVTFVSHSSKDDAVARNLEGWLAANGFTEVFVDHSSIRGGERWADALRAASGSCRVILCLVSENWLKSGECIAEFQAAWYMGKRIIPIMLIDEDAKLAPSSRKTLKRVLSEFQALWIRPALGRVDKGDSQ